MLLMLCVVTCCHEVPAAQGDELTKEPTKTIDEVRMSAKQRRRERN